MQESEGLSKSRAERGRERNSRRRKAALIATAASVVVAAVGGLAWFASSRVSAPSTELSAASSIGTSPKTVTASALPTASASAGRIEVPDLVGMSPDQAATVLKAAGLVMRSTTQGLATSLADLVVSTQSPAAGTVATAGASVAIVVPSLGGKSTALTAARKTAGRFVVVIDAGHQSRADNALEPIGPGSLETKPRITVGATGVTSGVPEYEIDLEIATNLQDRLEAAGVRVVMTRTTNDVDISNAQRAQIANAAKADLFVRVHADSSVDLKAAGVSTLYPAANQWTRPILGPSQRAADIIQRHLVSTTGATDDGSTARSDIAGFNWAKVPSVLVQTGFQSNQVEDRLLASAHYQDLVAQGMADGILAYLRGER